MKKVIIRVVLLLAVAGGAWYGYRLFKAIGQRQQQVATAKVRRGDVVVRSYARGELRAVRSVALYAPNLFGTVQVTQLASLGAFAREKDLVIEFDDSEVRSRLEEKELEIEQIDEQIKKQEADLAIRNNQDKVDLLRTQYAVRRAELEVKRNELISQIDAKKNVLSLEEAQRRLKQWQSDMKSRLDQAQAQIAVLKEQKNKSLLELAREKNRLAQVKLLAPMSGLVAIRQNRGGFSMMGMQIPDIREGDQVQPGMPVADVLDLSELEVAAKVGELDRANLHEGQDVVISLDAVADKQFHGTIKSLSGTASANMFSSDPGKKFDVIFSIDMTELLTALKAKPEQIKRVLAQAEVNRKKPLAVTTSSFSMGGFAGMLPGAMPGAAPGGMPGAMPGAPGAEGPQAGGQGAPGAPGGQGAEGGGGRQRGGQRFGFSGPGGQGGMSDEDRAKMRAAMQKELGGKNIQDLSPEERTKIFEKLRAQFGNAGGKQGEKKGQSVTGQERAGGERRGRGEGRQGGGGTIPVMPAVPSGTAQFTEKDLANAKLPPPPEEDNQLDVLLRPGLLADVEIIVEKIPNAIHIPNQAVFERDGKLVAYVQKGNKFEPRVLKPLKRSESTMVIADGLKAGEVIALSDPNERPGDKKKKDAKSSSSGGGGNPMGAVSGGGEKK